MNFIKLNVNEVLFNTSEIRIVYLTFMNYAKSCNFFNRQINHPNPGMIYSTSLTFNLMKLLLNNAVQSIPRIWTIH